MEKYDLEAENRRLFLTVNRRAMELRSLEEKYPGITRVEKNRMGSFVSAENPENELDMIIRECARKCGWPATALRPEKGIQ